MCEDRRAKVVVRDHEAKGVMMESREVLAMWGFEDHLACRESQDYKEHKVEKVNQASRVNQESLVRKEPEEDTGSQENPVYPVLREWAVKMVYLVPPDRTARLAFLDLLDRWVPKDMLD